MHVLNERFFLRRGQSEHPCGAFVRVLPYLNTLVIESSSDRVNAVPSSAGTASSFRGFYTITPFFVGSLGSSLCIPRKSVTHGSR